MHVAARCPGLFAFSWLLSLCLLAGCRTAGPKRLLADTRINDQPVRFAYDTGSGETILFTQTAKRLGLPVVNPPASPKPAPGKVLTGSTGRCRFSVGHDSYTLKLDTLHLPWPVSWFMDVDGFIGWSDMSDNFFAIDAAAGVIRSLDKLPEDTNGWSQFPIYPRTDVLALETPRADGKTGVWGLDTGGDGSVSLSPARWQEWRATHPHGHRSRSFSYMPGTGIGIYRQFTADELIIGSLTLRNVTVQKANQSQMGIADNGDVLEGSLGIEALSGLNVLIDQKDHVAWLRPRPESASTNSTPGGKSRGTSVASAQSTVRLDFREREEREDCDLAQEAFNAGDFGSARIHISRFLALQPDSTSALAFRGTTCYLTQQWDDAVKDFRHLGEVDSDVANEAQFFIWVIRARTGRMEAASKDLAAYLARGEQRPGNPWQANIGAFLLGRMAEADFLRASGSAPGDEDVCQCEAWFYAGMKRRLAGDLVTARDYFGKCLVTQRKDQAEYQFAAAELRM